MATKAMKKIFATYKKKGHKGLSEKECCAMVLYQLGQMAEWAAEVNAWETALIAWMSGGGGGGSPPQPPKWPPA
jgi:hypothetical protein